MGQHTPEDRSGDYAGEIEGDDDETHGRTKTGPLQHEPEQGDDGERSPRYEMLSPSQRRWSAGWRNGAPTAALSSLFTFMYFRASTRRRFPLQFDLIVINGGMDKIF